MIVTVKPSGRRWRKGRRDTETVNEELVEPEGPEGPEPIRVESDDSPDEELESSEDKTLVDVFSIYIETYYEN
jgi:hypothetical protein